MKVHSNSGHRRDLEAIFGSELRSKTDALRTGSVFFVDPSSDVCSSMELLVPRLLRRKYDEWQRESLDGIFVAHAQKVDKFEIRMFGTAILISDQTVTPFMVHWRFFEFGDSLESAQIRLGESGGGRLGISGPPCNSTAASELLTDLADRIDCMLWVFSLDLVAHDGLLLPK